MTPQERLENERDLMVKSLRTYQRIITDDIKQLNRLLDRLIASYTAEQDD